MKLLSGHSGHMGDSIADNKPAEQQSQTQAKIKRRIGRKRVTKAS